MELSNGFKLERQPEATVIRFTRPKIRNPLSIEILEGLIELLPDISAETLIFTGSEDVFASGADLREILDVGGSNSVGFAERGQKLMSLIASSGIRTIAAVNGYCYGGAFDLALSCDSRIAAPNAEFCHPGGGLGIMTGWGGTQRLPRLIGEAAALEIFLTAKRVSANEALRIGLVEAIADDPIGAAIQSCP